MEPEQISGSLSGGISCKEIIFDIIIFAQDSACGHVDIVIVFGLIHIEFHFVDVTAIVPVRFYPDTGNLVFCDTGVRQSGSPGLVLGDRTRSGRFRGSGRYAFCLGCCCLGSGSIR